MLVVVTRRFGGPGFFFDLFAGRRLGRLAVFNDSDWLACAVVVRACNILD
jgi:hypothetical protein